MNLALNTLIIIFAIIVFLIFYYRTLHPDRKKGSNILNKNKLDYEAGEEFNLNSEEIKKQTTEQEENIEERVIHHEEDLKFRYNKTFIRLFPRDPNWLYAYWEVNKEEFYENQPLLRLINETDNNYSDIEINHDHSNWYIGPIKPNNNYKIAIGYLKEGAFFPLAYSKTITTPADRPSDIIDEHWMTIEELSSLYYRIDVDSISILKSIQKRKLAEELKADTYSFVTKEDN